MDLQDVCAGHEGLLENVLSGLRQMVLLTDLDGRVLYVNRAAETMIGYRQPEILGENLAVLFTNEDLAYLYPNLLYLIGKNQAYEGEVMLKRKTGERFFAYMMWRPFQVEDRENSVTTVTIQDIDKQKQFEQALRETRFEDLVKIANGIAHELRNPLVGIGGFARRLYTSCQADSSKEQYYGFIVNNLKRIENLIKKIDLLVSLPRPDVRSVRVEELVQEAQGTTWREELQARGIELVCEAHGLEIMADRDLAVRSLSILIENAMDAMPDGGRIHIQAKMDETSCTVAVIDSGSGVPPEDQPFIFNPFFSSKADGAGIDLAIVKRIMEIHGGDVSLVPHEGRGAEFVLRFPFERRRGIRVAPLER